MKAILIEFDLRTGKRAGNINPRDPNLPCHGWQNLDSEPAIEIRLVTDDRDLSKYDGVKGVTILDGKETINSAIKKNIPARYSIFDMNLVLEHMKEKGISLDTLQGKDRNQIAEQCFKLGTSGILEIKPKLIEE